jgi:hypothetical protein
MEIVNTFGDINKYIHNSKDSAPTLDPAFEREYIVPITLPYNLRLAWDHRKNISTFKCHTLLADRFNAVFEDVARQGFASKAISFGGCFDFRLKRSDTGLSTHAWGIAIDLNPETNQTGTRGDMAPEIITIFQKFGFVWGGDWKGATRDPMHFQYCDGY